MGNSIFDETRPFTATKDKTSVTYTGGFVAFPEDYSPKRVDRIIMVSDDTVPHDIQITFNSIATDSSVIGTVTIPALAGYDPTIPPVDFVAALPVLGDGIIFMVGDSMNIAIATAITALKHVNFLMVGGYLY